MTKMTIEEFRKAKVHDINNAKYLGAWDSNDFFYVVFSYPNGARLRLSYWKTAEQVYACVRDYYGAYNCIGNNIKTMDEVNQMIAEFDWRMYDAKRAKKSINFTAKTDAKPTQEDMRDILEHLNKINK